MIQWQESEDPVLLKEVMRSNKPTRDQVKARNDCAQKMQMKTALELLEAKNKLDNMVGKSLQSHDTEWFELLGFSK